MKVSSKVSLFTESVIREMTRIAQETGSINLAQGFPDFDSPPPVIDAAIEAIQQGANQYSITWGNKNFRDAIANYYKRWHDLEFDPEEEITVCCGSTEAMISTALAIIDPDDEIIIFEPFYENYGPDTILSGATPKFVPLVLDDNRWIIDWNKLESAFSSKTAAIIINTPNNPTGKVFDRRELNRIAELCIANDAICITDEIYDHIIFDEHKHITMSSIPGMRERTVTINSLSKTFAVTGWRVGWAVASPELTSAIRKVHDFVSVAAPHPFQEAGARMLSMPDSYFTHLGPFYQERRDFLERVLIDSGLIPVRPSGAYYMMADISIFGWEDDMEFSKWLAKDIGVAVVPGSSFYHKSEDGINWVRFCFSKEFSTLQAAQTRLRKLKGHIRTI